MDARMIERNIMRWELDPAIIIIRKLQSLFPKAFPKRPIPKVPLKIGILYDLLERSKETQIPHADIKLALNTWCRSKRYWSVTIEGASRIDLLGNSVGKVTSEEEIRAKLMMTLNKNKNAIKL
ncbi:ProQ/FinO family protein [Methylophilus sp. QUAN]|nr:ProQ/FinO family protein [Methylophilus sp. QUAN]